MQVAGEMTLLQNIDDFKVHYRVTRQSFEVILEEVAADLLHCNVGGVTRVAPDPQFLVFFNYVTNQHSMRNCGYFLWNVYFNSAWYHFIRYGCPSKTAETCKYETKLTYKYIYMYMGKCVHF